MGNTLTAAHWTEVLGRKRENLGRPRGLCCPESLTFSKWSPRRPQAAVTAVVFPLPGGPRRRTQLVPVSKAPLKPENSHLHPQFCPDLKSQKQTRVSLSWASLPTTQCCLHSEAAPPTPPVVSGGAWNTSDSWRLTPSTITVPAARPALSHPVCTVWRGTRVGTDSARGQLCPSGPVDSAWEGEPQRSSLWGWFFVHSRLRRREVVSGESLGIRLWRMGPGTQAWGRSSHPHSGQSSRNWAAWQVLK